MTVHDWRFVHASVNIEPPGEWRVYQCAICHMLADAPLSPCLDDRDEAIVAIEPWLKGDKIASCEDYRALVNSEIAPARVESAI